ncbi:graves disease carrier protein isoform X1 [Balamuthia mandrillaris]
MASNKNDHHNDKPSSASAHLPDRPAKAILAGAISGGIEACATFPLEYIKTIMQVEPQKYLHIRQTAALTYQQYGGFGFYRGMSSVLLFAVPRTAVRFVSFESSKAYLQRPDGSISTQAELFCGLFAGVVEAITVTTKMETIKVKLIKDQLSSQPRFRHIFHGVGCIVREEGLSGIYKALVPTVLKIGINQALRFSIFNELKRKILNNDATVKIKEGESDTGEREEEMRKTPKRLGVVPSLLVGGFAGSVSVFVTAPLDVVKTKMQGLPGRGVRTLVGSQTTSMQLAKAIWKEEGFLGFYRGVSPRLIRVCLEVALIMTIYEQVAKALDTVLP